MDINYQKIYEQLGNLFYSIAAADNEVKPQEVQKLKEIIDHEWLQLEDSTDEFGIDSAHYIFIAFDFHVASSTPATETFQSFADYYAEHSAFFPKNLKRKVTVTATAIANAFSGSNKTELSYLTQLQLLLQ